MSNLPRHQLTMTECIQTGIIIKHVKFGTDVTDVQSSYHLLPVLYKFEATRQLTFLTTAK